MDWYTNWFTEKQVWIDGSDKHLFYSHNEGGYYSSPSATVTGYSSASIHQQAEDFASTQRFLQTLNEAGIQTERTNSRTVALASWISLGALPEFKGLSSLVKSAKSLFNPIKGVLKNLNKAISVQKQARHLVGTAGNGKGFVNSIEDAQAVLDAVHSGDAKLLGTSKSGNLVYRCDAVTGTNVNIGAGVTGQPTNVFMIKGTTSVSVVPTSPTWKP